MKGVVITDIALVLDPDDNVATALDDLSKGTTIQTKSGLKPVSDKFTLSEEIPFGHKFALDSIGEGEPVRKFGEVIGIATEEIQPGQWIHTHNCESKRGRGDLKLAESRLNGEALNQ